MEDYLEEDLSQYNRKAFYKRKLFVIPMICLMFVAFVSAAAIFYHQTTVKLSVDEALSSSDNNVAISGYPGETLYYNVTVHNSANAPLNTLIVWDADPLSNPAGVTYNVEMPSNISLSPGSNVIPLAFKIASDSEIGNISGSLTFSRIP